MRKLLAVAAITALLAVATGGWLAIDRQIRVVKVEGPLAASEAAEIRSSIEEVLNGRLLSLDVSKLRKRVMELSWPGGVSVRKVWPDTVVIRVSRRTVVARWAEAGYLTPAGEIVSTPNGPLDVPVFECALSTPRQAMEAHRYLQYMAEDAGLVISRLSENRLGEWQLEFSYPGAGAHSMEYPAGLELDLAGPTVMLGAGGLRDRMERFLEAWSRLPMERVNRVDYVDLRYGTGVAVRWREPDVQQAETSRAAGATETT